MSVDSTESLAGSVEAWKARGKTVGLVFGTFDLVHAGHIALFEQAAMSCDVLVAAVFDDPSARVLKGPGRPFMPEYERAEIVAAFSQIDAVTIVDGLALSQKIAKIAPDISFTSDSLDEPLPGRVVRLDTRGRISSTDLAAAIAEGVDFSPGKQDIEPKRQHDGSEEVTFHYAHPDQHASHIFTFRGVRPGDLILGVMRDFRVFYEIDVLQLLHSIVRPGGVAIDVGANIGNHAVYFAAYIADVVIALEPAPDLFALLQVNLEANGLANVVALRYAAGKRSGTGHIHRPPGWEANAGSLQVRQGGGAHNAVRIRTVDEVVEEQSVRIGDLPVTLLKIDVEGGEHAVLLGAQRTIERYHPVVAVELVTDHTFNAVNAMLYRHGYRLLARLGHPVPLYVFVNDPKRPANR